MITKWHQAGFGTGRCGNESQTKHYVSEWRHGCAAKGEPSTVMRTTWFDSKRRADAFYLRANKETS